MRTLALSLATIVTLSGCAAPGSAIGRIGFSGNLDGVPLDRPVSLRVTLPKAYGLGGLDLVMNTAEDFGQKDQTIFIELKAGSFEYEFPPLVYHITFWLMPPLGAFPRQPPAPVFVVTFPDANNEIYLVGMDGDNFRYDVYKGTSREKLKHEAASWLIEHGDYTRREGEPAVWFLRIKAKPNPVLRPMIGDSQR